MTMITINGDDRYQYDINLRKIGHKPAFSAILDEIVIAGIASVILKTEIKMMMAEAHVCGVNPASSVVLGLDEDGNDRRDIRYRTIIERLYDDPYGLLQIPVATQELMMHLEKTLLTHLATQEDHP
jgi:hypothetical protein